MVHYIPKKISELNAKSDTKVAVEGKIIKSAESSFILSDETGRVEINFDNAGCLAADSFVRVFCTISNDILNAEAVQDLTGLDADLFMKIKELYRKVGV